tara:strand:- start:15134 stop:21016 length:5883 start_codon:yes stop_codon:yes gene_type:complete
MAYDKTIFNRTPYYDDFDEDKKFLRMLFQPGYAVQARELTQAQTILQNQIQRFGDHIFDEGARVLSGEVASQNAYYLRIGRKVRDAATGQEKELIPSDWENFEIQQNNAGVDTKARVLEVIKPGDEDLDDYWVFIIQFVSGSVFQQDAEFSSTNPAHEKRGRVARHIQQNPNDAVAIYGIQGLSKVASVNEGIFYTNGYFVKNDFQSLTPFTLDTLNRRNFTFPTSTVGFSVQKDIVTSTDDPTLRDPANGTYNYNAPGANRFRLTLKLTYNTATGFDETDFIELLTYTEGKVTKKSTYTEYAALEDTLARRTFDESGSYTVRPFELDLREHLAENNNRGVYTEDNGGDRAKATVTMNPGKAYIFGYEFETQSPEVLDIDKARDIKHQVTTGNPVIVPTPMGPYVVGNVLGAINANDGAEDGEGAIRGFANLLTQTRGPDNGYEGKAKVRFYYKEWSGEGDPTSNYGKLVYAGTAFVNHIVRDDDLWTSRNSQPDENGNFHPQDRRHSSYWRFYISDLDTTSVLPLDGGFQDMTHADLDKVYYGPEGHESYMVLADDNDRMVYDPEEFDIENADPTTTPIWTRWIAGGNIVLFTDGDGNGIQIPNTDDFYYFRGWEGAPNNKLIHDDTKHPSLVFPLPEGNFSRDVNSLSYSTQMIFDIPKESVFLEDNGFQSTVTIRLGEGLESLPSGFKFTGAGGDFTTPTVLQTTTKARYYALTVQGDAGDNNWDADTGEPFPLFACPMNLTDLDFILEDNGRTLKIRGFDETGGGFTDSQPLSPDFNYSLVATVEFEGQSDVGDFVNSIRTKTLTSEELLVGGREQDGNVIPFEFEVQDSVGHAGGYPMKDGDTDNYYYELKHADILRINSIKTDSGVDRSNDFIFDNGQRDTEYSYGRLYVKNSVKENYLHTSQGGIRNDTQVPGGLGAEVLRVEYDYFAHSGKGPIIANSYITPSEYNYETDETDTKTKLRYSEIPVFTSPITGKTVQLAHCVDFRHIREAKFVGAGDNVLAVGARTASRSYVPRTLLGSPGDILVADYTYFLPRIDKVVLTKRLSDDATTFDIIKGIPALEPVAPEDREDSMTLYQLTIPPYTFNVDDIRTKYIENKRYTMRDIGKIEDRVGGLEYFTTLTDLEQKAASATLVVEKDMGEGTTEEVIAFKNAILVDSFRGHGVGDVANNDYRCSIDFENGTLRPSFNANSHQLYGVTGANSGITVDGNGIARIAHGSTISVLSQLEASSTIKANPFYLTNWMGKVDITPYGDSWWDVNYRPVIRVNTIGEADAWKSVEYSNPTSSGKGFGSQWNDWESMWYGLEFTSEDDTELAVVDTITSPRTSKRNQVLPKRFEDDDQSVSRTTETIAQKKTRVGVQIRSIPDRIKKVIGNRIVDVSIVPFVRPKELTINAHGLKPNTNVYCFFDGVNVTTQTKINGGGPTGGYWRTGVGADAGRIKDLKFTVPAGQYEAGEKLFRFIDDSDNDVEFATTSAESPYYAQGLKLSRDGGAVSIRPPVLRRQTVSSERVVANVFSRETVFDTNSNTQYIDPLAQTFTINAGEYPGGLMLDAVDVYFANKHTDLPITLQIRPTVQGAPHSSIIIPFSEVVKYPTDVTLNSTNIGPITPTRFQFSTPVFLEPGQYSLCFVTNTGDYELFMGELGELDIRTQNVISGKTYVNDLYEPQNGSVAQANTTKDLMFELHRADYTTAPQTLTLQNSALGATSDVDAVHLHAKHLKLSNTGIQYDLALDNRLGDVFSRTIEANLTTKIDKRRKIKEEGTATVDVTMQTSNPKITPMVDTTQSNLVSISNFISSDMAIEDEKKAELNGRVGCHSRYITRRVSLPEGASDPNAFQVILEKAGAGDVQVYMKAVSGMETRPFDEVDYIQLERLAPVELGPDGTAVPDDSHRNNTDNQFTTLKFALSQDDYNEHFGQSNGFSTFAVKICMTTDGTPEGSVNPPIIKDLRAIALTV